jgi:hypothetical protein
MTITFIFNEGSEMLSDSSKQFKNNITSLALDSEGLSDVTGQFSVHDRLWSKKLKWKRSDRSTKAKTFFFFLAGKFYSKKF